MVTGSLILSPMVLKVAQNLCITPVLRVAAAQS
jgi:hypothetical protein